MSSVRRRYCVFGCQALSTHGVPLHQFPNPDKQPELFDKWVSAVGDFLEERNHQRIYNNKRVCDHHFFDHHKITGNRIIPSAIPSHQLFCVPQSLTTFVLTDHSYSRPRRGDLPMIDITNLSDLATHGDSIMASTSSPCSSRDQPAVQTTVEKFDAEPDPLCMKLREAVEKSSPCPDSTAAESLLNQIHNKNKDKVENNDGFAMEQDDFDDASEIYLDNDIVKDDDVEFIEELRLGEDPETRVHADFKCNVCHGDIIGFRYTCVQCADWDMCAACEARGEHPAHYVLRLPAPKPYAECEPVIAAIREQISYLLLLGKEIKSEVYVNEDTSIDLMTEEFDPNLTDPFSASNDRTVPELTMQQESAPAVNTADLMQEVTSAAESYMDSPSPSLQQIFMHQESAPAVNTADLMQEVTSAAESYMDSPSPSLQKIFMHQESATVENITDLVKEVTSAESNMDSSSPGVKKIVIRYKTPDLPVKRFYIIGGKSRSNSKKYVVKEFTKRTIQAATKTHSNVHKVK